MKKKYFVDIDESPATKHKISSGKIGSKNIKVNIKLSLPFSFFCHFFKLSSPTIHATALLPSFLPIKNAEKEPRIMPIRLYNIAFVAPNSATPAKVLTTLGIGKTMTCKYCNTMYSIGIHAPDFSKYSCKESEFFITLKKPVFCNMNKRIKRNNKKIKRLKISFDQVSFCVKCNQIASKHKRIIKKLESSASQ